MWYEALCYVSGKRILLSEVEERWEEASDEVQVVLGEYFARTSVGVVKSDSERRVLFQIGEEWCGFVEKVRAERAAGVAERRAYPATHPQARNGGRLLKLVTETDIQL